MCGICDAIGAFGIGPVESNMRTEQETRDRLGQLGVEVIGRFEDTTGDAVLVGRHDGSGTGAAVILVTDSLIENAQVLNTLDLDMTDQLIGLLLKAKEVPASE